MQDGVDRPLEPRDLILQARDPLPGMVQLMPEQSDFRIRLTNFLEQTAGHRGYRGVRCHGDLVARPHQTLCRLYPPTMLAVVMNRFPEAS